MPARSSAPGWLVAVQDTSTTLSPARDVVLAFDLEGRPTSLFSGGSTYKRSLASGIYGRRTVCGVRRRWHVSDTQAEALLAQALEVACWAHAAVNRGERIVASGLEAKLSERLERIVAWTPATLLAERARFDAAYAPISILPPDQYGAAVLQASFGCSWNRCTYCTFYQDRPFQVRSVEAFAEHLTAVSLLLGRAAEGRRRLFLADGNALVLSNERLRPLFEAARAAFPGRPFAGFVDVFSGERKPARAWGELRSLGLRGVSIGIETGHDPLLGYLNKPGSAAEAAAFVSLLKQAGLQVSVIFMVGVGGRRYAEGHVRDSAALFSRLPLGRGDIVYLSPFVRHADSAYAERAAADALVDLDEAARSEQERALRVAARAALPAATVARYHIDEFVY